MHMCLLSRPCLDKFDWHEHEYYSYEYKREINTFGELLTRVHTYVGGKRQFLLKKKKKIPELRRYNIKI